MRIAYDCESHFIGADDPDTLTFSKIRRIRWTTPTTNYEILTGFAQNTWEKQELRQPDYTLVKIHITISA